jgi:hypothetical protein
MYLDDCIVFATGDEQFLERLETVFKRFKERNIFLKASTSSSSSASATTSVDSTQPPKKQKGKLLSSIDSSKIDITYSDDVDSDLIQFFVSPVSEQPQPRRRNKVHALLDTGSLAGNFIAFRILQNLSLTHHMYKNSKKMCSVCSGLDNQ